MAMYLGSNQVAVTNYVESGGVQTAHVSLNEQEIFYYTDANMTVQTPDIGEVGYYVSDDLPIGTIVTTPHSMLPSPQTTPSGLTMLTSGGSTRNGYYRVWEVTG